jgi:hypothetical protein
MRPARDRRRRFDGRYTYVYSQMWRDPDVKTLSRDARHLLFCLTTGSLSTQAGDLLALPGGDHGGLRGRRQSPHA